MPFSNGYSWLGSSNFNMLFKNKFFKASLDPKQVANCMLFVEFPCRIATIFNSIAVAISCLQETTFEHLVRVNFHAVNSTGRIIRMSLPFGYCCIGSTALCCFEQRLVLIIHYTHTLKYSGRAVQRRHCRLSPSSVPRNWSEVSHPSAP